MMRWGRPFAAMAAPLLLVALLLVSQSSALRIPGCPHQRKKLLESSLEGPHEIIWGAIDSDQGYDGNTRSARAMLQAGGGEMMEMPTGVAAWNPRVHGYTAAISFGIVMPFAVIISRCFREYAPAWIYLHAPLGLAAFIGGVIGVAFGGKLPSDDLPQTLYEAHKAIGSIVTVLAGIQILAIVLRPKVVNNRRFMWNLFHHWSGRLALVLAIVNVYLGLHLSNELAKFFWGYAIVLGALILLWLAKELIDLFRVLADNRRVDKDGYQASRLPGGIPMNGDFAPVFLQRRPADATVPIAGHGLRPKVADAEAPIPQDNVSYTSPAVGGHKEPLATTNGVATNGAGTTGLLHQGGYGVTNGVNGGTTTGMLHPGGSNGNVEMARI